MVGKRKRPPPPPPPDPAAEDVIMLARSIKSLADRIEQAMAEVGTDAGRRQDDHPR